MLFHWFHLSLHFLLLIFLISKFFIMINFLAHWSTYSIIFFRKGTLTVCILKPCTLEIVFLLLFHMKANVSRARILGTQYLLLEIASKKEKGNLHSKLKLFTAVIMWTVLHCFLPVFVFFLTLLFLFYFYYSALT